MIPNKQYSKNYAYNEKRRNFQALYHAHGRLYKKKIKYNFDGKFSAV